eukprot:CAMPEP_0174849350 /NCGR_PEP_ID=MMETSP1114-20130205/15365_1 /TAXON_ID=312471 /ORGANISM="Neobodo designis, Strain CCAP 1951/1" /LENGTH=827 /DNA_ID=CAMNT_0016083681 /DNA_START=332 /DNA_END=2815 /DNA_ORIENTATION=+
MSVFGVDLGALNSVVAVTRQGGVDIICNEVSKRETATFVSYMGEERLIGESGYDKLVRNAQNTVSCVKRLIGMRVDDPRLESEMRFVNCRTCGDAEGRLQLEVQYNDETVAMYPEQILAAFLGKLRKYVCIETKTEARDCVVSVPVWYTAEQRKLVQQACEMANIKSLSLINETTAAAVDYGIFRASQFPETEADAQAVAICDIGYAGMTVTIAKFWKGQMKVLAHAWDHEVSTRELDWALFTHFVEEIKKKYKIDVMENRRAKIRLLQACDKLKCMLSANPKAPMNIENLMDIDVAFMFTREELDATLTAVCDKMKALCARALERAGIEHGKLHAVEVIGGGSRVPSYKQAVSDGFGVPASFTLNASESIARGCAITAATFSPLFQVREYVVNEAPLCPLMLGYHSDKAEAASSVAFLPDVNKTMAVLRDSDRYPKTLELTFNRTDAFDLHLFYDENHRDAEFVPKGKHSIIGQWTIGGPGTGKTTNGSVVVTLKFHASGLVTVDGAHTKEVYEVEVEEKVKKPAAEKKAEEKADEADAGKDAAAEGEGEKKEEAPKEEVVRTKKQQQRRLELSATPKVNLGLTSEAFLACKKIEAESDARDLTIQKTREVRNELESYVYDNRSRISDGDLKAFVTDSDRTTFVAQATEIEDWLYGDGDNAPLAEYQTRLDKLKVIGAACMRRLRLSEDIPFAHGKFVSKVEAQKEIANAKKGKAAHITDEEIAGAVAKCDEALAWGAKELEAYQAKAKHEDPSIAPSTFDNKAVEVENAVKAVVNKKAPPPPKKEEKKEEKKDNAEAEKPASPEGEQKSEPASPAGNPPPPTDLD